MSKKIDFQHDRYIALEGIRGIAAFLVVARHMVDLLYPLRSPSSYLAVDIFFVLSGFVLSVSYENRLRRDILPKSNFLILRIIRLYPLYLLGSLLGLIALLIHEVKITDQFDVLLRAVFFVPILREGIAFYPLNFPSWSLFFELFISFVYGIILFRLSSKLIALIALVSTTAFSYGVLQAGSADIGYQYEMFFYGFTRIFCSFTIGILIYRIVSRASICMPAIGNPGTLLLFLAIFILLVMPIRKADSLAAPYAIICISILFPTVTVFAVFANPTGWLKEISIWLGRMSFPVYALHAPVIFAFKGISEKFFDVELSVFSPYAGVLTFACILLFSFLADRYFDDPVRRILRGSFSKNLK